VLDFLIRREKALQQRVALIPTHRDTTREAKSPFSLDRPKIIQHAGIVGRLGKQYRYVDL